MSGIIDERNLSLRSENIVFSMYATNRRETWGQSNHQAAGDKKCMMRIKVIKLTFEL